MAFSKIEKGKQRTPPARCGRCGKTKGAAPRPGYRFPLCPGCARALDEELRARAEAADVARVRFGDAFVVGRGNLLPNGQSQFYVGEKDKDRFVRLGAGASWAEAFATVRRVAVHFPGLIIKYAPEVAP